MVALCLSDNALVIHTHYSNGCWYKDLLTSDGGGGQQRSGSTLACILRPLPSDCLPLQQPAPPLTTPLSLIQSPLAMVGVFFYNVCAFLWTCTHACLIDIKIYGLRFALGTCY